MVSTVELDTSLTVSCSNALLTVAVIASENASGWSSQNTIVVLAPPVSTLQVSVTTARVTYAPARYGSEVSVSMPVTVTAEALAIEEITTVSAVSAPSLMIMDCPSARPAVLVNEMLAVDADLSTFAASVVVTEASAMVIASPLKIC